MNTAKNKIEKINELDFETAMSELENVVSRIESGEQKLDDSIADYEYGIALKNHLNSKLDDAKLRVDRILAETEELQKEIKKFESETQQ